MNRVELFGDCREVQLGVALEITLNVGLSLPPFSLFSFLKFATNATRTTYSINSTLIETREVGFVQLRPREYG